MLTHAFDDVGPELADRDGRRCTRSVKLAISAMDEGNASLSEALAKLGLSQVLTLRNIQALNVLFKGGGELSEANAMVVHEHVGEPSVFNRGRGLFDDHAIHARARFGKHHRQLTVLQTNGYL
jgi:hypothetical protein